MLDLTETTIKDTIASDERPMLVDVWASWCSPCKAMIKILEELEVELGDRIRFGKIDMEQAPEFVQTAGVRALPTLIFYQNGLPVAMKAGATPKDAVRKWLLGLV